MGGGFLYECLQGKREKCIFLYSSVSDLGHCCVCVLLHQVFTTCLSVK